ncbi:MAG: 50S ribosomal protein L5 [Nanoarchaeota archaeon]|nr:50S ribosomal protein L5 [Nanoarchaeota archaeon]
MNTMKNIRIEKLTLNVGAGTNPDVLKKGMKLIQNLTGKEPIKTISDKRIPTWGVRPGLPIGCKITLRGDEVAPLIKRLIAAKEGRLSKTCFDSSGNVAFGIHEYINVPELNYDASIGIMGFQACITLMRPGYRVKTRRKLQRKLGKSHRISQEDSIAFFKENFKVIVED